MRARERESVRESVREHDVVMSARAAAPVPLHLLNTGGKKHTRRKPKAFRTTLSHLETAEKAWQDAEAKKKEKKREVAKLRSLLEAANEELQVSQKATEDAELAFQEIQAEQHAAREKFRARQEEQEAMRAALPEQETVHTRFCVLGDNSVKSGWGLFLHCAAESCTDACEYGLQTVGCECGQADCDCGDDY